MMFQFAFETMDSEAYGVVITGPERVRGLWFCWCRPQFFMFITDGWKESVMVTVTTQQTIKNTF